MSINLLPPEEKTSAIAKKVLIRKLIYGILCSLALIVIINIGFGLILMSKKNRVDKLEKKYQEYKTIENDIKILRQDLDYFKKELSLMENFFSRKFYWSEKLLIFAQNIPEEIWLQKLIIAKDKDKEILNIKGSVLNSRFEEKPLSVLNRFIKNLKEDRLFFKDFSDIILIDVKLTSVKNKEVLEFNMELPVRK